MKIIITISRTLQIKLLRSAPAVVITARLCSFRFSSICNIQILAAVAHTERKDLSVGRSIGDCFPGSFCRFEIPLLVGIFIMECIIQYRMAVRGIASHIGHSFFILCCLTADMVSVVFHRMDLPGLRIRLVFHGHLDNCLICIQSRPKIQTQMLRMLGNQPVLAVVVLQNLPLL